MSLVFMRRAFALVLLSFALSASAQWRSGATTYSDGFDIYTGYMQNATGYIVSQGYVASPPQPVVGQRFYVSIYVQAIASISRYMTVHFIPPAGTSIVNDAAMPVRCFYRARSGSGSFYEFTNTIVNDVTFPDAPLRIYGCPQPSTMYTVKPVPIGTAYLFDRRDPNGANHLWPMPGQAAYEFLIPVVVDRPMDGINTNFRFYAPIQAIQGDGIDPWTHPFVTLLVRQGSTSADMQASLVVASQTASSITLRGRCSNLGPDAATNATCTFAGLPAGATVSCTPSATVASLAAGSAIECLASFLPQVYSVSVSASSATTDPTPANATASASGTSSAPLIYANGFD